MGHGRGASESCRAGSPSPGDHALTVIGYIETVAEVLRSTLSRFVCMMICCVKPSSVSTQVICLSSGEPARLKSLSRHLLPVSEPRKIKSSLISSLSLHTRHPTRTNTPTFLLLLLRGIGVSLPQECSAAEQVFYTWVARSRSGSSSFTALALNKPSSSSSSSSYSGRLHES